MSELRFALYRRLAPLANRWSAALSLGQTYPQQLPDFLADCAAAGQAKPTPLLLRYEAGGYNCLHQDLYGSVAFPLQVVLLLSCPGRDFTGGEFTLVEQRPQAQSIPRVAAFGLGDALVFTTRYRPVAGRRGTYRVNMRHGVSQVTSGVRTTLGIIFHNAA